MVRISALRTMLVSLALLGGMSGTLAYATPLSIEPTSAITAGASSLAEVESLIASQQAELNALNAQLEALDRELELASEAFNAATVRLTELQEQVILAGDDLAQAEIAYNTQVDLLNKRAGSIYRQGSFATIELLLESKSVKDLVDRVKFLNTMGVADARVAESLLSQKNALRKRVLELQDQEALARSLEFELEARSLEVEGRIEERQAMLSNTQSGLLELLAEQAEQRRSEEAALMRGVLGGDTKGVAVEVGSPVETALSYVGVPYLWGGATPDGFDCSGLLMYVFAQHGLQLPHYSGSQFLLGEKIAPDDLLPGDAVFFGSPIHHVGMYVGGGYFIHAPRTGDVVKLSRLADRSDYAGARRYVWTVRTAPPLTE